MLRGDDDEFRSDSSRLLQDIRSLLKKEEGLKDLKLMGGRRKNFFKKNKLNMRSRRKQKSFKN